MTDFKKEIVFHPAWDKRNFCPECGRKAGDIADLIEQEKSDV